MIRVIDEETGTVKFTTRKLTAAIDYIMRAHSDMNEPQVYETYIKRAVINPPKKDD